MFNITHAKVCLLLKFSEERLQSGNDEHLCL